MRHRHYNLAASFLLAWLIVVQTVAGATAAAQPMLLDAFGNPLCTSNSESEKAPGHDKSSPLDCCMVGCCAATCATGATPDGVAIEFRFPNGPAFLATVNNALSERQSRHEPGNPRAPPAFN